MSGGFDPWSKSTGGSSGGVTGPGSSTDGDVVLFNGATGAIIKDSGLTLAGTNTGDVTVAAFGASPTANGISISGQALTAQPADATHPGMVTTGAQSWAGAKTFSGAVIANGGIQSGGLAYNLTAAGTNQSNAYALSSSVLSSFFSTVASGTGCKFPHGGFSDTPIFMGIFNGGANTLNIYPFLGDALIDPSGTNLGTNNPYVLAVGAAVLCFSGYASAGIWALR